ncbi:hypothetical protein AB6805_30635 [Chitinophaga sp. RCC_12]|uniref:hypothetical protein n=1 Tax=Chitinophaga sp. RCC_12 TaxID=3239226 RepID=UPI003523F738
MIDEKEILSASADSLLDNSVQFEVDVMNPKWWERIAIKFGWLPAKKTFNIRPTTLGNMIRISKLLLSINVDSYRQSGSPLDASYQVYDAHGRVLAEVIATAISNSKRGPTNKLVDFIQDNLSAAELLSLVSIVLKKLDVMNFMTTIISIRGMSLLNPGGTIASGEPLEGL